MLNQSLTLFAAVENKSSSTLQATLSNADLTTSTTLKSDEPTQARDPGVLSTVGFRNNTFPSELSDSESNKPRSDVLAAVGVIVGVIAILIIVVVVRYFKNRSRPRNSLALMDQQNNDMTVTYHPSQTVYEDVSVANGEMAVNQLYVSADIQIPNEPESGQNAVYSTPMKKRNPKQNAVASSQEATYSTPIKRQRPEMVDNALYKSYDG